jgi:hypothetical protein
MFFSPHADFAFLRHAVLFGATVIEQLGAYNFRGAHGRAITSIGSGVLHSSYLFMCSLVACVSWYGWSEVQTS